jgi:uncharacterized membrane protein YraQ (UPF0718 family)
MAWMDSGMSVGAATAFMITGLATKIVGIRHAGSTALL